jgi:hypothetical protein
MSDTVEQCSAVGGSKKPYLHGNVCWCDQGKQMSTSEQWSFTKSVERMAGRAFDAVGLDSGVAGAIKSCDAVLQVRFPV